MSPFTPFKKGANTKKAAPAGKAHTALNRSGAVGKAKKAVKGAGSAKKGGNPFARRGK